MIGFEAALQLCSFNVLFLFYINGSVEKQMHSIPNFWTIIQVGTEQTSMCCCQYIFPKQFLLR